MTELLAEMAIAGSAVSLSLSLKVSQSDFSLTSCPPSHLHLLGGLMCHGCCMCCWDLPSRRLAVALLHPVAPHSVGDSTNLCASQRYWLPIGLQLASKPTSTSSSFDFFPLFLTHWPQIHLIFSLQTFTLVFARCPHSQLLLVSMWIESHYLNYCELELF